MNKIFLTVFFLAAFFNVPLSEAQILKKKLYETYEYVFREKEKTYVPLSFKRFDKKGNLILEVYYSVGEYKKLPKPNEPQRQDVYFKENFYNEKSHLVLANVYFLPSGRDVFKDIAVSENDSFLGTSIYEYSDDRLIKKTSKRVSYSRKYGDTTTFIHEYLYDSNSIIIADSISEFYCKYQSLSDGKAESNYTLQKAMKSPRKCDTSSTILCFTYYDNDDTILMEVNNLRFYETQLYFIKAKNNKEQIKKLSSILIFEPLQFIWFPGCSFLYYNKHGDLSGWTHCYLNMDNVNTGKVDTIIKNKYKVYLNK